MATVQVWPAIGITVKKEGGYGVFTPGEVVERTTFVQRRLDQKDLLDYDPTGQPYYPFIDEQSVVQGRVGTDLDTLRGHFNGATTLTTGRNSQGDGNGGNFTWDATSTVTRNGTTVFGLGPTGRWIQTGTVGGGGGASFTGPSVSFTADGTINTTGIADAAYFALVPNAARVARGLTPPTSGANINVRHAFNNSNFSVTVPHEDTGASATARFATDDGIAKAWPPKTWMSFSYDSTLSRYRVRLESDPRSLLWSDLVNTAPRAVGEVRQIHGRTSLGDGGDGYVRAVASAGLTIDGGTVSASATAGYYWQRIYRSNYVSAKWYGAGNGGAGDGAALLNAYAAVSAGSAGGTLHCPRGRYKWDYPGAFTMVSNTSVLGDGRDSIWERTATMGQYGAIHVFGTTGCRIRSLTMEQHKWVNFFCHVNGYSGSVPSSGVTDLLVDGCRLYLTQACYDAKLAEIIGNGGTELDILGDNTLHGVLIDNGVDVSIVNCSFGKLQAKMATYGSATRVRIEDCTFDDPIDYAASVVTSGTPTTNDFIGVQICGNFVENARSSGVFYIGSDAEIGEMRSIKNLAVHGNIARQNVTLAGVQVLVHLGASNKNISICNNILSNESSTFDGSYLIRVRSTGSSRTVDGLLIAGNICDGADHAGIGVDIHGKHVIIANNILSRCRGVYVWAANGTLDTVVVANNVGYRLTNVGYYFFASTGNLTNLLVDNCVANDIESFSGASAGAWFEAASSRLITAKVVNFRGKKKDSNNPGLQMFWQLGAGNMRIEYVECDSTEWRDFVDLDCGIVLGHHNKGYGAPDFETVTVRTPDVASPSDDDVLARCWGKVKYVKVRLAAPITGANVVTTYKCETAAGSGTFNTVTGTSTIVQAGSDEGQTYWVALSGTNDIVPRAKIRASNDGGASNGIAVIADHTFWIDRAA